MSKEEEDGRVGDVLGVMTDGKNNEGRAGSGSVVSDDRTQR